MSNPFASPEMAAGYARSRPPVHPKIIALALDGPPVRRALDVGCGSGLSTRAIKGAARVRVGIEPAVSMLPYAPAVAPGALFAGACSEALPFADGSFDLITAAGSLNYSDPGRFFPEAARALAPGGRLLIYDFSQGRSFRDSTALDEWFVEFVTRYPQATADALDLNLTILSTITPLFRLESGEDFEIGLPMTAQAYTDYAMTETNIVAAERAGTPRDHIRRWCAASVDRTFGGRAREVLFRGYYARLVGRA